jgi:hypothetical protein
MYASSGASLSMIRLSIRGYFRIHTSFSIYLFIYLSAFQDTLDREVAFSPAPGARSNVEIEISKWVV